MMLPTVRIEPYSEVKDIDGFMTTFERGVLVTLARNMFARSILEIGVNEGETASVLLAHVPMLSRYWGIEASPGYMPGLPHQRFEATNRPGWKVRNDPRFNLLVRPRGSLDLARDELPKFDLVIIDGDHSFKGVSHDTKLAFGVVSFLGAVVWHDYDEAAPADVYSYINSLPFAQKAAHIEGTRFAYYTNYPPRWLS